MHSQAEALQEWLPANVSRLIPLSCGHASRSDACPGAADRAAYVMDPRFTSVRFSRLATDLHCNKMSYTTPGSLDPLGWVSIKQTHLQRWALPSRQAAPATATCLCWTSQDFLGQGCTCPYTPTVSITITQHFFVLMRFIYAVIH